MPHDQNQENEQWEEEVVNAKLLRKMNRATDAVIDTHRRDNGNVGKIPQSRNERGHNGRELGPADLRTAAYILAIRRVADVALQRGIWP